MTGLRTLLKKLNDDASLWTAVKGDPLLAVKKFSLTKQETLLLFSGDAAAVREALGEPRLVLPEDFSAIKIAVSKHDLLKRDGDVPYFN